MKIRYAFCVVMACLFAMPALAQSTWQRKYDAQQLGLDAVWSKAFGVMYEIAPDTVFWYASVSGPWSDGKVKSSSPYAQDRVKEMNASMVLLLSCPIDNEGLRRGYLAGVSIECPKSMINAVIPIELQGKVTYSCTRWLKDASPDQRISGALSHIRPLNAAIEMKGTKLETSKPGALEQRSLSIDTKAICGMNLNGEPLKPVD